MKILHLSDLHLGKRVNGFSMIEDQIYILEQIQDIITENDIETVLIAGDVYDRSIPSEEAVSLFDQFLKKLKEQGQKVLVISGNHDSACRLSFGSGLMRDSGVYISESFRGIPERVDLQDSYGVIHFYLLPYIRSFQVREAYPDQEIAGLEEAVKTVLDGIELNPEERNILLAHQFVTGARLSESEELQIGGLDQISAQLFSPFDYTALGHIHRAQTLDTGGSGPARYSGTLLKYSFSEITHHKSATVIEIREKGVLEIKEALLTPKRDLRELRGSYEELTLRENYADTCTDDYLHVILTDEEDIPDAIGKLRLIYPNIMKLDYDNTRTRAGFQIEDGGRPDTRTPYQLLEEFYQRQNGQAPGMEQKQYAEKKIADIWDDREASERGTL